MQYTQEVAALLIVKVRLHTVPTSQIPTVGFPFGSPWSRNRWGPPIEKLPSVSGLIAAVPVIGTRTSFVCAKSVGASKSVAMLIRNRLYIGGSSFLCRQRKTMPSGGGRENAHYRT